jgi:serine/threonine protein kinase, bacterial
MINRPLIQFGFLMAAMTFAGCAGAGDGPAAAGPGSVTPALRPATHSVSFGSDARRLQTVVYISNLGNAVPFFTANIQAKNPKALGSITAGVTHASGLWVDRRGTLYVVNSTWPPSLAEYKRGALSPFKIITKGMYAPASPAVDSSGNLYVTDTQNNGEILVYPPGASSPSRSISIPRSGSHAVSGSLAFDNKGDLLVATFDVQKNLSEIYGIPPGSSQAENLNFSGLAGAALGADKAGNIYDGGFAGGIAVYAPGTTSPARWIQAGQVGFYSNFTVTPNGTIYWPNYDANDMYEFAPRASSPTNVFEGGGGVDAAVGPR